MRLKHVKGAEEAIENSGFVVQDPENMRGRWRRGSRPFAVEIGMGKGSFITGMAAANPDTDYAGIEKFSSVLIKAVKKQQELQLPNLLLIRADAEHICEFFAPGEADVIYLNFSDPWPKDRHAKRRLTSPQFLERYLGILAPGGRIEFKTDNMPLFEYSVESLQSSGWQITAITRDLHADPAMCEGNIMTEYEERFSAKGNPIAKLIAYPPLGTSPVRDNPLPTSQP